MKAALISLLIAAPVLAADAPKADAPKAEAPKPAAKTAKPEGKAPAAAPKDPYKNDDERGMYTIGFLMGRNIASFGFSPAEMKIVQAGLADGGLSRPPLVDVRFQQSRINDMLQRRMSAGAEAEKAKGKAFAEKWLKDNKTAQEIPGGGWYVEVKPGAGALAKKSDTIKAHYRGTGIDGVQFDSSYDRGAPTEFSLSGVIKCWTNGISMMKVGGQAKLLCPSDAAYGDPGRPGIRPGQTLLFDVELVEIVAPAAEPAKKK